MLNDLISEVDAEGFGDGLHEGIVSLMILIVNPQRPVQLVLGGSINCKNFPVSDCKIGIG